MLDNTGPVVSVTSPGMFRGTFTVNATATDATAVQNVAIQYRTAGAGAYTTLCTDLSSPYSCPWNSTSPSLSDGSYDVRAVATDTLGNQSTSAVVGAYVNNTGPTGTDVQSTNGGTNDKIDAGDTITFTYSEAINPDSILAGWNGSSTAIRVRVNNTGATDAMEFYNAANTTALNLLATGSSLSIEADYVTGTTMFNATIVRSGSTFTVTIGTLISGAVTTKAKGKAPMTWQTNSAATGQANGRPALAATVTESGALDVDF